MGELTPHHTRRRKREREKETKKKTGSGWAETDDRGGQLQTVV